jgi:hypothetical protein
MDDDIASLSSDADSSVSSFHPDLRSPESTPSFPRFLQDPGRVIVTLASGENHPVLDLCYNQVFTSPEASTIVYLRGDYQLVKEDRCLYCSKLRLFKIITTLFPFIPLSPANFYRKTVKLREAENRTDLCPQCEAERKLRVRVLLRKGRAPKLTEEEQRFIALWAVHRDRATHQRRMLQL